MMHNPTPVTREDARLLIIGGPPRPQVRPARRYRRDLFWKLIQAAIDVDLAPLDHEVRIATLLHAGIGMWDSVAAIRERAGLNVGDGEGSAVDLPSLIATLPSLRAIAFNGFQAERIAREKMAAWPDLPLIALPHSALSSTRATGEDRAAWARLRDFL